MDIFKKDLVKEMKGLSNKVKIFVSSDQGQVPEPAFKLEYTDEDVSKIHYADEVNWKEKSDCKKITAMLILS